MEKKSFSHNLLSLLPKRVWGTPKSVSCRQKKLKKIYMGFCKRRQQQVKRPQPQYIKTSQCPKVNRAQSASMAKVLGIKEKTVSLSVQILIVSKVILEGHF